MLERVHEGEIRDRKVEKGGEDVITKWARLGNNWGEVRDMGKLDWLFDINKIFR